MRVIVDFCIIPLGTGDGLSLSPYIAECQRILEASKLDHTLHAYGTNIEGEWEAVMAAVKRCHMRVHEMGAQRISSTLKVGTRIDRVQTMQDKISSVEKLLSE
ncbi:uncharacterized protein (TIGR00106 family) [Litorivivens lipolytica]|uniref:Uncharacterized protein (TIGR00106 family) n=1 Tax=Litorivivens lipolytica TaxID=1524264 RepID=A0A7W4W2J4_9GAMM|nr:MTH1187 family thiamine-binding protein [Litorivivens lipolytica]MBB3046140.1 uncharacterized protein (TIGR00106 family) [Litorivivens lipolytica]